MRSRRRRHRLPVGLPTPATSPRTATARTRPVRRTRSSQRRRLPLGERHLRPGREPAPAPRHLPARRVPRQHERRVRLPLVRRPVRPAGSLRRHRTELSGRRQGGRPARSLPHAPPARATSPSVRRHRQQLSVDAAQAERNGLSLPPRARCDVAETLQRQQRQLPGERLPAEHATVCRGVGRRLRPRRELHRAADQLSGRRQEHGLCRVVDRRRAIRPRTATASSVNCPADAAFAHRRHGLSLGDRRLRRGRGLHGLQRRLSGRRRTHLIGTICRSSAGVCDVAEACDGTNKACPADDVPVAAKRLPLRDRRLRRGRVLHRPRRRLSGRQRRRRVRDLPQLGRAPATSPRTATARSRPARPDAFQAVVRHLPVVGGRLRRRRALHRLRALRCPANAVRVELDDLPPVGGRVRRGRELHRLERLVSGRREGVFGHRLPLVGRRVRRRRDLRRRSADGLSDRRVCVVQHRCAARRPASVIRPELLHGSGGSRVPADVPAGDTDGDGTCDLQDDCPTISDPSSGRRSTTTAAATSAIRATTCATSIGVKPKITIVKLLTPPGDDKLKFKGSITIPPQGGDPTLDPAIERSARDHHGLDRAPSSPTSRSRRAPTTWRTRRGWKVNGSGDGLHLHQLRHHHSAAAGHQEVRPEAQHEGRPACSSSRITRQERQLPGRDRQPAAHRHRSSSTCRSRRRVSAASPVLAAPPNPLGSCAPSRAAATSSAASERRLISASHGARGRSPGPVVVPACRNASPRWLDADRAAAAGFGGRGARPDPCERHDRRRHRGRSTRATPARARPRRGAPRRTRRSAAGSLSAVIESVTGPADVMPFDPVIGQSEPARAAAPTRDVDGGACDRGRSASRRPTRARPAACTAASSPPASTRC